MSNLLQEIKQVISKSDDKNKSDLIKQIETLFKGARVPNLDDFDALLNEVAPKKDDPKALIIADLTLLGVYDASRDAQMSLEYNFKDGSPKLTVNPKSQYATTVQMALNLTSFDRFNGFLIGARCVLSSIDDQYGM